MSNIPETTVADDQLRGAHAIAKFLGRPVKQVYRALERGAVPAGKEPGSNTWVASKRRLLEHHTQVNSGGGRAA